MGKTLGAAALVNWFFDSFGPSITITTAPTKPAVVEKLWKNIKKLRAGKGLSGRVLPSDPKMVKADDHFALGQTTSDSGGQGTERFQGQHDEYLFFVLDEAEGIPAFVYKAVRAMMTGGKVILVLVLANPRTRTSPFHKLGQQAGVATFRQSCLNFPNVVDGVDTVPGGTTRAWVCECINDWCEVVSAHNDDDLTFSVPFEVPPSETAIAFGPAGTIYRPNTEFMFRVLGIAPANVADDTFVPVGRYEAACKRAPVEDRPERAWMGIDAAGYGNDLGTLYVRHNGLVWRAAQMSKPGGDQDPTDYWLKTRKEALSLAAKGVKRLHIRIDAGGGFGIGVYDLLKRDEELREAFAGEDEEGRPNYQVLLVHFGGAPKNAKAYRDLGTEMYAEAAESLKGLAIHRAPEALEADLCERRYEWVNWQGVEVKKLQEKKVFKREQGRSPDDGDGFVLCVGPDFLFGKNIGRMH